MYTGSMAQNASQLPPRVKPPSHRHGTPSGPWPFLDIDDQVDPARIEDPDSHLPMSASPCEHTQTPNQDFCWCKYPQSMYPNWALRQQKKSKILKFVEKQQGNCKIYYLDVMKNGLFIDPGAREINKKTQDRQWVAIQEGRPKGVLVRALFVENLNGNTLRILGTRYNIEPFFFSSTIGWIPSRYQSHLVPKVSDHVTITLTFIRSVHNPTLEVPSPQSSTSDIASAYERPRTSDLIIDTQAPLPLRSGDNLLLHDLLAVHMIRSPTGNTIISLHPGLEHRGTTAENLHLRVHLTGRSVYWSNISKDNPDPTFVFLSVLWYALYAWDEALENLYNHICFLESDVMTTHDFDRSNELHVIQAHLLHYDFLLQDFKNTVLFVRDTPNPALLPSDDPDADKDLENVKKRSAKILKRECDTLVSDIKRLEESRDLQTKRLKNVMDLGFSKVTIEESKSMKKMTEASVKDSAAMKQIAYLTMAFLPASFVAAMFGMNVKELTGDPQSHTTIPHYVALSIPLTAITIWIIVAYQIQITEPRIRPGGNENSNAEAGKPTSRYHFYGFGTSGGNDVTERRLDIWGRLWWPVILLSSAWDKMRQNNNSKERGAQTRIDSI